MSLDVQCLRLSVTNLAQWRLNRESSSVGSSGWRGAYSALLDDWTLCVSVV